MATPWPQRWSNNKQPTCCRQSRQKGWTKMTTAGWDWDSCLIRQLFVPCYCPSPQSSASTGPRFLLVYIALTGYSGYVIPQGSTEKTASFSALPWQTATKRKDYFVGVPKLCGLNLMRTHTPKNTATLRAHWPLGQEETHFPTRQLLISLFYLISQSYFDVIFSSKQPLHCDASKFVREKY